MNVLYLTHRLPYAPDRGDRIRSYHTLRTLARTHAVHVISLVHDREEAQQAERLNGVAASVRTCMVRSRGSAVLRGALRFATSPVPLTHLLLDSGELETAVREVAQAHPPDVVLAFCSGMARVAMQPPLDRVPWVLDMVDADSAKWREMGETVSPVAWIYRREARCLGAFEQQAMAAARSTTVVNEREREILLAGGGARIEVVPNGVDVSAFRRPRENHREPRTLVFSAVFSYSPNADAALWLLDAVWPRVQSRFPDARLVLVGADPPVSLRRAAERYRGVEVTGRVPEVAPYLWSAGAAVAPLRLSRGVQNKLVLEAVAAGLPVSVTRAVADGLPPEVLAACRVADAPEDMARDIVELLDLTDASRRRIVDSARLDDLTWERRLQRLTELIVEARERPLAQRL